MISMSSWIARLCYRHIMPQIQFIYCIEGSKMTRSFKWVFLSSYAICLFVNGGVCQYYKKRRGSWTNRKQQKANIRKDMNKYEENNYKNELQSFICNLRHRIFRKEKGHISELNTLVRACERICLLCSLFKMNKIAFICAIHHFLFMLLVSSNFQNA